MKTNRNVQGSQDALKGSEPITTRQVKKVIEQTITEVTHPKRHLSFFERQLVVDLGLEKSLDAHGNINLNESANQASQSGQSRRVSPNVLASQNDPLTQSDKVSQKSVCHRHCKKSTGRSSCPYCLGQGYDAVERAGSNQPRSLFPGQD